MKYDIDHYIKKFEDIPDDKWCMYQFICRDDQGSSVRYCAYGQCGAKNEIDDSVEASALYSLTVNYFPRIDVVNDNLSPLYTQDTPKLRILAYLNDIKQGKLNKL